ncbi:MAG: ornithine cyclodeaminase family protein [Dehalococcoidia bacterium]|nr:ornithine cyclodeaminase family protein [Dehalococcoidia bacterium]
MDTLLLTSNDLAGLLDMKEVIGVVEQSFKDYATGKAQMPSKVYLRVEKGDFRAMPGAVPGAVGMKWVNVHPLNRNLGLPTVMGIILYSDPHSGYPLAIMDAADITAYRTAATSAIASKYLARPESRSLGLIGAGRQAHMHLLSHAAIFTLDAVKVYDVRPEAAEAFVRHFPQFNVKSTSAEEALASDIVCTLTPATAPVVKASWVKPGTHINAVGADAPGKEELEPGILNRARVVVDDVAQACHAGEINMPVRQGLFRKEQIWASLGEIVAGARPGRPDAQTVTVFDSTGLAIEDVAAARLVYEKARKRGGYLSVDLIGA